MPSLRRAFNLLETVIAVALFSTFCVIVIGVWELHHRALAQSGHRLMASFVGQQEMNRCIALGYSGLTVGDSAPQTVSLKSRYRDIDTVYKYTYKTNVQEDPTTQFRQVTVVVTWSDPSGQRSLNYTTYLHKTAQSVKTLATAGSTKETLLQDAGQIQMGEATLEKAE